MAITGICASVDYAITQRYGHIADQLTSRANIREERIIKDYLPEHMAAQQNLAATAIASPAPR